MGIPYAEVIGDPIAHSKSPAIHKFGLEKLGIEADFRAVRITPEGLPAYLASRRLDPDWHGCNLTMPLKTLAADLVDRTTAAAGKAGAVNCISPVDRNLIGTNTDMAGIVEALWGLLSHNSVCLIGAGGAARAAVAALWYKSINDIRIVARSPASIRR